MHDKGHYKCMRMYLIIITIVILIISKIHYVTNTQCNTHESVSHRNASEALSLARTSNKQ